MSQVSFAKLPKPTASQPTPQEERGVVAHRLGHSAEPNRRAEDRDEREDEPDVNCDRVIALGALR